MRKRISDANVFLNFDMYKEWQKIETLFISTPVINERLPSYACMRPRQYSIERYLDDICFSEWHLRGTALSTDELRKQLGISKENFVPGEVTRDQMLDYLQYVYNCNAFVFLYL